MVFHYNYIGYVRTCNFSSNLTLFPSLLSSLHFEVSLYLRLYVKCGIMTEDTENIWRSEVIKVIVQLPMDPGMVAEVKKGLEFGRQVDLPSNLSFSPLLLANLFVGEGYMRPFQQLR